MLYFSDYTDKISVGNKSWQSNMFPTTFLRVIAKVSLFSAHMKISGKIKGFAWANYRLTHSINPKKKQCLKQCIFVIPISFCIYISFSYPFFYLPIQQRMQNFEWNDTFNRSCYLMIQQNTKYHVKYFVHTLNINIYCCIIVQRNAFVSY